MLARLGTFVADARLTLCGFFACVDASVSLHDAAALLAAVEPAEAVRFAAALVQRAEAGIGGELLVDWPGGSDWLDSRLAFRLDLGGTAPHAARALCVLGAPALLALQRRGREQLAVLEPDVSVARAGQAVPVRAMCGDATNANKVYIFEYTQGRRIGRFAAPRSSRIIVRFCDPGLENDPEFAQLSRRRAATAGAALVSGFNAVGPAALGPALVWARSLASDWLAAGVPNVHLELAGYDRPHDRDRVLAELRGSLTSLGLSLSELHALMPGSDVPRALCTLAERYDLRRVCVHADTWAAAATLDDPEVERDALLVGNLLASSRAAHGRPIAPTRIPAGAVFEEPPAMPQAHGAWRIVVCAAPYLARPATTVGLGDTFTAGCLLVLGRQARTGEAGAPHPRAR